LPDYFRVQRPGLVPADVIQALGGAAWLEKEMRGIKEQMRGPEAKGVDIVNFVFTENPFRMERVDRWTQLGNSFEMTTRFDLQSLVSQPPIDNMTTLLPICAARAAAAPWPQVRALAAILGKPLDADDIGAIDKAMKAHEKKWGPGGA
jgi:hypothetical protein